MQTPKLLDCGHMSTPSQYTGGYGQDENGKTLCYACCADQDRQYMIEHGKITLFLSNHQVRNWPGSLVFPTRNIRKGKHNIAHTRYDVWFVGPDNHVWRGVQYGNNTMILHCKRTKALAVKN